MDNLKIWNAVKQPPTSALRQILGGRLKGKTDINPQWRYKAMTEQFGVCGEGWKYEIERVWNEPLPDGQILAFAEVLLFHKDGDKWSDPTPGIGGSMLVEKETAGLHASDEAYKMAITDALSVCMKMLGVGGDVYMGLWDGTKYNEAASGRTTPKPQHISDAPQALTQPLKDGSSILPPTEQHYCQVHDVAFKKMTKGDKSWWSHRLGDGSWCNEPKVPDSKPIDLLQQTTANLLELKNKGIWTVDRMLEELAMLGFEGDNVGETVKLLPAAELIEFHDIIQEALKEGNT